MIKENRLIHLQIIIAAIDNLIWWIYDISPIYDDYQKQSRPTVPSMFPLTGITKITYRYFEEH